MRPGTISDLKTTPGLSGIQAKNNKLPLTALDCISKPYKVFLKFSLDSLRSQIQATTAGYGPSFGRRQELLKHALTTYKGG